MTQQSYALIGIDRNGNQHPYELPGHTRKLAALRLLQEKPDIVRVANGDQNARNENNFYGKIIKCRPGFEPESTETALGGALQDAQMAHRAETARMIISRIERKGIRLACVEGKDSTEVRAIPCDPFGNDDPLTEEDSIDIIQHRDTIIMVLKEREAGERKERKHSGRKKKKAAVTDQSDEMKALIQSLLPELPQQRAFKTYDLELALRRRDRHDIADHSDKMSELLEQACRLELLTCIKPDVYRVLQPKIEDSPAESAPAPPPQKPPEPVQVAAPEAPQVPRRAEGFQQILEGIFTNSVLELPSAEIIEQACQELEDGLLELVGKFRQTLMTTTAQLREAQEIKKAIRNKLFSTPVNS